MLVLLQAVAFAGCVLVDLLPATEVECRFGVPLATWSAPAPAGESAPTPSQQSRHLRVTFADDGPAG